jgi:hypothetical protein
MAAEVPGGQTTSVYTLDVDLDGRDEVLRHTGASVFEIWRLDSGTWSLLGELPFAPCLADWGIQIETDSDGDLELVLFGGDACGRSQEEYDPALDVVTILSGRARASLPTARVVPAGIRGHSIHAGDLDGDGQVDLLIDGDDLDSSLMRGARTSGSPRARNSMSTATGRPAGPVSRRSGTSMATGEPNS